MTSLNKLSLAPIVLFVFARPDHASRTLEALAANDLAQQSELIIYADAARNDSEVEEVNAVRHLVSTARGFKSVTIIERKKNYGLARNIIEGVTEVCSRFGRVIVLEDDMITSPYFLTFMNEALNRYQHDSNVWHISGWNYPIDKDGLGDSFFWRVMNCWGWATWVDKWAHFQKDPEFLVRNWTATEIDRFNLGTADFWEQVLLNYSGKRDTWAVFWYATIFAHKGLCLNPAQTLVQNIGNDGTGENCSSSNIFWNDMGNSKLSFPSLTVESTLAIQRVSAFYSGIRKKGIKKLIYKIYTLLFVYPKLS